MAAFWEAVAAGHKLICLTSPTGGGKTRMISEITREAAKRRWATVIFTNRKLLTHQAAAAMQRMGLDFGVVAAGWDRRALLNTQIASLQTIHRRALATNRISLPPANLVIIDEAHSNKGDVAKHLIAHYLKSGAIILGVTATPTNIGEIYKHLIVAGTKAELRQLGALVPCDVFSPDEPDLKGVRRTKVGEVSIKGQVHRIMQTIVFANVFKAWSDLNPEQLPTILFAPGVRESRWFVEQWQKIGVTAAHVDADTSDEERLQIFADSKAGKVKVICSQGVLREGVDLPWLRHGILVQPCNALTTYLQIVGRLLRAYPGKTRAILQDHAGVYHRHGSPNEDHEWKLRDTDKSLRLERLEKFRAGQASEPIRCPECGGIRKQGPQCPHCGHKHVKSVRLVRMTDGSLRRMVGNVNKRKRLIAEDERVWKQCLYSAAMGRLPKSLRQVAGDFYRRTGRPVPMTLRGVPRPGAPEWDLHAHRVFKWLPQKHSLQTTAGSTASARAAT